MDTIGRPRDWNCRKRSLCLLTKLFQKDDLKDCIETAIRVGCNDTSFIQWLDCTWTADRVLLLITHLSVGFGQSIVVALRRFHQPDSMFPAFRQWMVHKLDTEHFHENVLDSFFQADVTLLRHPDLPMLMFQQYRVTYDEVRPFCSSWKRWAAIHGTPNDHLSSIITPAFVNEIILRACFF